MKTNDDGKFCMHVLDSHDIIFSCDQAALQMVFSVCPSVCHTFLYARL